MKNVGVIGAGWIGMDFVKRLSGCDNGIVRFTNRTAKDRGANREGYRFEFGEELPVAFLNDLNFLFITSTLSKENKTHYIHFIEELTTKLPSGCVIVFTSTIGVYTDKNGVVDESSIQINPDSVYYQFEQLLTENFPDRTIILRLGGLIGDDRHPVFSLSGRKTIPDGQKAVNLIHKEDILSFFQCILNGQVEPGIYNLVYPKHLSRRKYYTAKAQDYQLVAPEFIIGSDSGKIISSEKSQKVNGFDYKYTI